MHIKVIVWREEYARPHWTAYAQTQKNLTAHTSSRGLSAGYVLLGSRSPDSYSSMEKKKQKRVHQSPMWTELRHQHARRSPSIIWIWLYVRVFAYAADWWMSGVSLHPVQLRACILFDSLTWHALSMNGNLCVWRQKFALSMDAEHGNMLHTTGTFEASDPSESLMMKSWSLVLSAPFVCDRLGHGGTIYSNIATTCLQLKDPGSSSCGAEGCCLSLCRDLLFQNQNLSNFEQVNSISEDWVQHTVKLKQKQK